MNVTKLRPDPFEEVLAAIARGRGYNTSRVAIVAQQFDDAARRMNESPVFRFSTKLPSGATESELQAAGLAIAMEASRHVLKHCLRELATLGPCEVRVDAKWVPPLAELDPEVCRLSWRIELSAPVPEAAIRAVFDWVTGECDLNLEPFGAAAIEAAPAAPAATTASASTGLNPSAASGTPSATSTCSRSTSTFAKRW